MMPPASAACHGRTSSLMRVRCCCTPLTFSADIDTHWMRPQLAGHRLKNAGCKLNLELKRYKAKHRLLLTGTHTRSLPGLHWQLFTSSANNAPP